MRNLLEDPDLATIFCLSAKHKHQLDGLCLRPPKKDRWAPERRTPTHTNVYLYSTHVERQCIRVGSMNSLVGINLSMPMHVRDPGCRSDLAVDSLTLSGNKENRMSLTIEGVAVPDSKLAREITEVVR